MEHIKFNFENKESIVSFINENGLNIPWSDDASAFGKPLDLSNIKMANRVLAQPIEGFDSNPDGSPSERSSQRYIDLAKGGSGAIWFESISVNHEGRSNKYQLWITEENWPAFKELIDATRAAADKPLYLIAQLTHSGRNSNPDGTPTPVVAFKSEALPKDNERIITDEQLDALVGDYVNACKWAELAGFDAVDIRSCHGYLINELFSAVNREGRYGGSFENRTRLLFDIIDRVQKECKIEVGVRLNMYDGIPYPFGWGVDKEDPHKMDLSEPAKLVSLLYEKGVRLLNITNGVGAYSPFIIRPYDYGGLPPFEHPLEGVERMQNCAKLAKELAPEAVIVASGFTWMREFSVNAGAGGLEKGWYDVVGYGRESIAHPDYANDILLNGCLKRENCCMTCCGCTNLIKVQGKFLRCVFKDRLNG